MKTNEWTPKRRSRALGLIQGRRHSLSEITQITNIPKRTLGNLKKRNTPLNKPRSGRPHKRLTMPNAELSSTSLKTINLAAYLFYQLFKTSNLTLALHNSNLLSKTLATIIG